MIERQQPICTGVDAQGNLLWKKVAMARWQMEMIRVRYYGDFMAHWILRQFCDNTGHEPGADTSSMELRTAKQWKPKRPTHSGD